MSGSIAQIRESGGSAPPFDQRLAEARGKVTGRVNFSRAPGLGGSGLSADLVWFGAPGDETRRSERAASALAQSVSYDYWGEMSFADQEKVLRHMAGRAAQCRRLARSINDDRARNILLQMAEEIEADMGRLSAGEGASDPGGT